MAATLESGTSRRSVRQQVGGIFKEIAETVQPTFLVGSIYKAKYEEGGVTKEEFVQVLKHDVHRDKKGDLRLRYYVAWLGWPDKYNCYIYDDENRIGIVEEKERKFVLNSRFFFYLYVFVLVAFNPES